MRPVSAASKKASACACAACHNGAACSGDSADMQQVKMPPMATQRNAPEITEAQVAISPLVQINKQLADRQIKFSTTYPKYSHGGISLGLR
jgi:hypothetical protein